MRLGSRRAAPRSTRVRGDKKKTQPVSVVLWSIARLARGKEEPRRAAYRLLLLYQNEPLTANEPRTNGNIFWLCRPVVPGCLLRPRVRLSHNPTPRRTPHRAAAATPRPAHLRARPASLVPARPAVGLHTRVEVLQRRSRATSARVRPVPPLHKNMNMTSPRLARRPARAVAPSCAVRGWTGQRWLAVLGNGASAVCCFPLRCWGTHQCR